MGLSNAQEDAYLNWFRGTAFPAVPSVGVYVALFYADPGDAGSLTNEVATSTGYARRLINIGTTTSPKWTAPADDGSGNQMITNDVDIDFPEFTVAPTGPITHWALMSTISGAGTMYDIGALSTPQTFGIGGIPRIKAGQLKLKRS